MNKIINTYSALVGKAVKAKAKLILFVLVLVLFVLGSGAPEAGGGVINSLPIFRF